MSNFRVIVAFNRVDYFERQFDAANERNYARGDRAPASPTTSFIPLYGLVLNLAQVVVLAYGFYLIAAGQLHRRPADRLPALRQQLLHAAAPARRAVVVVPAGDGQPRPDFGGAVADAEPAAGAAGGGRGGTACWRSITCSSATCPAQPILRDASFAFEPGKTYALVGPDRRRQDHDGVADGAALRSERRAACCLNGRDIRSLHAGGAGGEDRLHPAGAVSLHRHGPRQHRLRQRRAA